MAMLSLGACEQAESARKAVSNAAGMPDSSQVAPAPEPEPANAAEPLDLGELDGAVHQLESALDLLMADRYGPDGRPLSFPETPPSVLAPPEPFDVSALAPRATPPEPVFEGLPPEDTVPADIPGGLLRLWSEGSPDQPVAMADSVHREVAMLRRDIQRLNNNLESLLHHYVGSLHEENERLRQELQRMYVMRMQEGRFDTTVPRPNQGALEGLREDALMGALPPAEFSGPGTGRVTMEPLPEGGFPADLPEDAAPPALEESTGVMAMAAFGGTQYAIIEEWGRTPEEARAFGEGVSSLKGLILAVPPGLSEDDLAELAYHLREEYDPFDNINVKVFEGVEAAQKYAGTNEVTPGLLVADVTKHAATQRDIILVQRDDELTVLSGSAGARSDTAALPAAEAGSPQVEEVEAEGTEAEEMDAEETGAEEPSGTITIRVPSQAELEAAAAEAEAGPEDEESPGEEEIPLFDEEEPVPIFVPADQYDAESSS